MAIDKLIPRYINKEDDARLVKAVEMTDALNIRISSSANNNANVIKNAYGNTAVSFRSGDELFGFGSSNSVIGAISDNLTAEIFYFAYNSLGWHSVYRYSTSSDESQLVHQDQQAFLVDSALVTTMPTAGAVYSAVGINGSTFYFQVTSTTTFPVVSGPDTLVYVTGYDNVGAARKYNDMAAIRPAGTLTKVSGTGDASIGYSLTRGSILRFSEATHIRGNIIKNIDGDSLLYFTDGNTPPKKINATKAIVGGYPSKFTDITSTDDMRLAFITTAKTPPLVAPSFSFSTDATQQFNNLFESEFQFSAQYIYEDGEESAMSPYSELAISKYQLMDGVIDEAERLRNNVLTISVADTSLAGEVAKVRLLVRNGNDGTFYIADEKDYSVGLTASFKFRNTELMVPVSPNTVNKMYDAVPITAESQTIIADRLVYGGYKEGYANLEDLRGEESVLVNYGKSPRVIDLDVTYPKTSSPITPKEFKIDISSIPAILSDDSLLNLSFSLDLGRIEMSMNDYPVQWVQKNKANDEDYDYAGRVDTSVKVLAAPLTVNKQILIPAGSLKSEVVDLIKDQIAGNGGTDSKPYPTTFDSDITDYNYLTRIKDVISGQKISNANKWMFFKGAGYIRVDLNFEDGNTLVFGMGPENVVLTADYAFNYNLAQAAFNALRFIGATGSIIRSFISKSSYVGEKYPNLNALSNRIVFVDPPSVTYTADGVGYSKAGTPSGGNKGNDFDGFNIPEADTGSFSSTFLNGDDDEDKALRFSGTTLTTGNIEPTPSFKSGATYSVGIVYYDERNRASGVQRLNDLKVANYYNRPPFATAVLGEDIFGASSAVFRPAWTPPSWAKKWAPVISDQSTIINKVQYTIAKAYLPSNLLATDFKSLNNTGVIYLSFRTLEGKNNSYKEGDGANLQYAFEQGDRLRVLNYLDIDGLGNEYTNNGVNLDFNVLGYYNFDNDSLTNPILDTTTDDSVAETTGWFIAIKATKTTGWSQISIIENEDNWQKECFIQLYRYRRTTDTKLYYEVGKFYDVVSDSSGNKYHQGDRNVLISANGNIPSIEYITSIVASGGLHLFGSNTRLYSGDIIEPTGKKAVIKYAYENTNPSYAYTYIYWVELISGTWTPATFTNIPVTNYQTAAVEVANGDVYFRPRRLRVGNNINESTNTLRYIEDYSVSDFFDSKSASWGRPHIYQQNAKTLFKRASITFSDPYLEGGVTLGMSSFNTSLNNFVDYEYRHGIIKQLAGDQDRMFIIQERRSGIVPVGRNVIEYTDGNGQLAVSNNIFGVETYYLGDYGINNNPESFAFHNGRCYFADIRSGKIIRISRDGITPISEEFMDAYFKGNFSSLVNSTSFNSVVGGIDVESDQYIVSTDDVYNSIVTIGGTPFTVQVLGESPNDEIIVGDIEFNDSEIFRFSTDSRTFTTACDEFSESVNAIVYMDKLIDGQPIYVGTEFIGQTGTIYGVITDSSKSFYGDMELNLSTRTFTIPNPTCSGLAVSFDLQPTISTGFTISYDVSGNAWISRYSYKPERIISIDDTLFTFKNGTIYKHISSVNRNTYYGAAIADSIVEVISNYNPSMVKSYEALSLEGDSSWAASISNTDQSTSILASDFDERERNWYAYIPRDNSANTGTTTITSLSGSSEIFALGAVASVSGSDIVFNTNIGYIGFPIGASLYKVSGSTLVSITNTIASVSNGTTITCASAVAGVSAADEIVAIGNAAIEGDQIRDNWMKVSLSLASATETELYAINAYYVESKLHNQLGQ